MKNTELIRKYELALEVAEYVKELNCQASQIQAKLTKLNRESYKPTTLDEVWVDYFLDMNKEAVKYISEAKHPHPPEEADLAMYLKTIDFGYKKYEKMRGTITHGFISREIAEWLADQLYLNESTEEQLRYAIDAYFQSKVMHQDEYGE